MKYENYFGDMFESIPIYRKIVLLMFLIINDCGLLKECGFLKSDINRMSSEFDIILLEQNEEHLNYIKNQEESVIEIFFKK